MIKPVVRMEVYKKIEDGERIVYPDEPNFIIDDFVSLDVQIGIEKKKDTINFNVINHKELGFGTYAFTFVGGRELAVKDVIKLYAWNDPMTPDTLENHLVLLCEVKSWSYDSTEAIATLDVTAMNRTELLLNSFMFAPYNEGEKVPNMIVDSMNKIKNFNTNDIVYAYKDYSGEAVPGAKGAYDENGNPVITANVPGFLGVGYVQAYKKEAYLTDGSGVLDPAKLVGGEVPLDYRFEDATFTETYKPFIQHLETVSKPEYLGDDKSGAYVFYVDNDNNLHWKSKNFNITDTYYEYDHTAIKVVKDVDEVINAVIMNCGTDPNQNGVLTLAFNASSMAANGARWKYYARPKIGDKIRQLERESGDWVDEDDVSHGGTYNAGNSIGDDGYPASYPWTPAVTANDEFGKWNYVAGTESGTGITDVDNKKAYKTYFRRACKAQGQKVGKDIVKYSGDPILKIDWELEMGTLAVFPNTMYSVDIPSLDRTAILRLVEVAHTFDTDWKTTLKLKEDLDYNYRNAS